MFGLSLTTIGILAASHVTAAGIGSWLHAKWLVIKAKIQADEASLKQRVANLEAVLNNPPPTSKPSAPPAPPTV